MDKERIASRCPDRQNERNEFRFNALCVFQMSDSDHRLAKKHILGAAAVYLAFTLLGLALIEAMFSGLPFSMPSSWYHQKSLWMVAAVALIFVGWFLQAEPRPEAVGEATPPLKKAGWRPQEPGVRFRRVVVYGREECHLCDDALDLLEEHQAWLPEIELVDIDTDPALKARFDTEIPVVECDGTVRFRGKISRPLLHRLLEGTPAVGNSF